MKHLLLAAPLVLLLALLLAAHAAACSFCGGNVATRNTLREEYGQCKAVVSGTLKNPKVNADGISGTTEFQFDATLKTAAFLGDRKSLVIPKYFPVIGDTPPGYLFFFDESKGEPSILLGVPSTPAVVKYLTAAAKLDDNDAAKRLAFYFGHLDSADPTVSGDAFLEFAKASDADVLKAKAALDPKRLQKWLADPKLPEERVGVYAMLLGLCGEAEHAATFAALLNEQPMPPRVQKNLGGLLAGYTVLDQKAGWAGFKAALAGGKKSFEERYAALTGVRYLQATWPKETRKPVLALYRDLLGDPDFADVATEDLRRWGWWDLTTDVLGQYAKPVAKATIVKKAIVRYALTCPDDAAKAFVTDLRKADAKLVQSVEEGLKLLK